MLKFPKREMVFIKVSLLSYIGILSNFLPNLRTSVLEFTDVFIYLFIFLVVYMLGGLHCYTVYSLLCINYIIK